MGVYSEELVEPMAQVLVKLGVKKGMVVYGTDSLDEISMSAPTAVCEICDGKLAPYEIVPEQFGYKKCEKDELKGDTPQENATITRAILDGSEQGAKRQAVCMNAGAALYVAGKAGTLEEGVRLAEQLIDSGAALKGKVSVAELKERIRDREQNPAILPTPSFYQALKKEGMSYICEVKKASPSKGLIAPDFPYVEIAKEYEAAGASAISCLTEPFYFQGSDRYLEEITAAVNIPVLRKDFTVDEYMIYQAKAFGASAVLLICAILDDVQLREYRQLAESLGLDALVEAHDEREVERALEAGAKIVGVNNRDLRTFRVDMNNSIRLRNLAPAEVVFVSESGIRTSADINLLYDNRVDAVLIGETLMRSPDKKAMLETLNGKPLSR